MSILPPGEWSRYNLGDGISRLQQVLWKRMQVGVIGEGGLAAELSLQLVRVGVGRLILGLEGTITEQDIGGSSLYGVRDVGRPALSTIQSRLLAHQPHCDVLPAGTRVSLQDCGFLFGVCRDGRGLTDVLSGCSHCLWEDGEGALAFRRGNSGCPRCASIRGGDAAGGPVGGGLRSLLISQLAIAVVADLPTQVGASSVLAVRLENGRPVTSREILQGVGCELCSGPRVLLPALSTKNAPNDHNDPDVLETMPEEVAQLLASGVRLIDVREAGEAAIVSIPGGELVPFGQLEERAAFWSKRDGLLLYCKTGVRSARAGVRLRQLGFDRVAHLKGGILAWIDVVAPELPRY